MFLRAVLMACCLAATASAEPAKAQIPNGSPAPNTFPDPVALRAGIGLTAASYGAALGIAARQHFLADSRWLVLPIAGPWATLWNGSEASPAALAFDGVAQVLGAALLAGSIAYPRRVLGPPRDAGAVVILSPGGVAARISF